MKRLGIVAVVLVGAVVAYFAFYPTTSYRFRITLNIDTPQGLKSGSSVMEVRTWRYPAWMTLGNNTGESILKGEAVFVDLGPGNDGKPRNVIALLALGPQGKDVDFYLLPGKVFEPLLGEKQNSSEFRGSSWELSKLPPGTKSELRGDLIPTLVTFNDLHDSKSARVLLPEGLEQAFGKDIRLRDVQIEIVSAGAFPLSLSGEPLTRKIETQMPEILRQLREQARVMQVRRVGDPYVARLGHFVGA